MASSLITRCPNCSTAFRVVAEQLQLRGGRVRCGICHHVFDALAHESGAGAPRAEPSAVPPSADEGRQQGLAARPRPGVAAPPRGPATTEPAMRRAPSLEMPPPRADQSRVRYAHLEADDEEPTPAAAPAPVRGGAAGRLEPGLGRGGASLPTVPVRSEPRVGERPAAARGAGGRSEPRFAVPPASRVEPGLGSGGGAAREPRLERALPDDEGDALPFVAREPVAPREPRFGQDRLAARAPDEAPQEPAPRRSAEPRVGPQPSAPEPGRAEPAGWVKAQPSEPASRPARAAAQTARPASAGPAPAAREPIRSEPIRSEPVRSEPVRSASAEPYDDEDDELRPDVRTRGQPRADEDDGAGQERPRHARSEPDEDEDEARPRHPGVDGPEFAAARGESWPPPLLSRMNRQRSLLTRLFALGLLLALLVLAMQAVWWWRQPLATHVPSTRPALETVCGWFGCEIGYVRAPRLLSIESSSVQPDTAAPAGDTSQRLTLTAVLRNRAQHDQPWPSIELSLTDYSDTVVIRRVLAPADYLPPALLEQPFTAGSEQKIAVAVRARGVPITGYRLALFFP